MKEIQEWFVRNHVIKRTHPIYEQTRPDPEWSSERSDQNKQIKTENIVKERTNKPLVKGPMKREDDLSSLEERNRRPNGGDPAHYL